MIFVDAVRHRKGAIIATQHGNLRILSAKADGDFYTHQVQLLPAIGHRVKFYVGKLEKEGDLVEIGEERAKVVYEGRDCTIALDNLVI